jgi:glyoxylase-like metal-dependent hydrolase (beta-lactamase superfamily II)
MRRLIAASMLVLSALSACAVSTGRDLAPSKTLAPRVHLFASGPDGFDTQTYWIDTGREVVAFDAQFTPALAEAMLKDIQSKTASPVRYLVITHPNPDKFNGAPVFQKAGAKVVASEATARAIPAVHDYKKYFFVSLAKMFTEESYPALAKVDITFRGEYSLPLEGKVRVTLKELSHPGVSSAQTVAYVPEAKALFVGDLVHHQAHAWLEGGIREGKAAPDLSSWDAALDELNAYPGATVYGGRGTAAPLQEAVAQQKEYLQRAGSLVSRYVTELGAKKSELSGPEAGKHHQALRARFEKEFPEYKLSYMIEYGVYGLANATAAR